MNFSILKDFMDGLTGWIIPGNSVRVSIGGKEVFSYQSGYENAEKKIKMREDHLYNVFSCSKPITVTAAMQLWERGLFGLDDPLYEYIPEYRYMNIDDGHGGVRQAKNAITLRHLFTMTAGLTYDRETAAFKKARMLTDGKMDTMTVIRCLAEDPLSCEPGEIWQYSLCHDVLAGVVETVSGKRFSEYVRENIFEPLGMAESYYHNESVIDRVAELYRYISDGETDPVKLQSTARSTEGGRVVNVGKSVPYVFGSEYDSGGAGITTSVKDYMKFATAMALGGISSDGERIISDETVNLMRRNQLNDRQIRGLIWPQLKGYGYGLGVRTMMDTKSAGGGNVGEFGWGGAAGATLLVDRDLELAMFYTHHMLNPQEEYYQPRLRNALYESLKG